MAKKEKRFDKDTVQAFLKTKRIATLPRLKKALGTKATMTVFRKLKALGYLTSYSHRGKYYALRETPNFNELGLWSYDSVWFSRHGSLSETVKAFVDQAEAGFSAHELEGILNVEVKHPLLTLFRNQRIVRKKMSGVYVYVSADKSKQKSQFLMRHDLQNELGIVSSLGVEVLSHELKAAVVLFFSLLDEKQRRLYAGLESHKLGHGGDRKIAQSLGLDIHTVARGRRELLGGHVVGSRTRKAGGGRKRVEKKRHRSSKTSRR